MTREKNHKLNSIITSVNCGTTPEFKRPNHPDFMTSSELRGIEFTGIRKNEISLCWEFWIVGEVKSSVSFEAVQADEFALTKAHVELFNLIPERKI